MRKLKTIQDVVDWGMCVGCGACFAICEKPQAVELVNIPEVGVRPRFNMAVCSDCNECLQICPGYRIDAKCASTEHEEANPNLLIGPTLEVWEGHAADDQLRFNASSGGILSALAAYCLEKENMAFVLHTGMDPKRPWQNKTVISRDRSDILANAGSRYAASSPCEMLNLIEESDRPCVFIGKPCDAAAVTMARSHRPRLDRNLGAVLSFFCAGTPCSAATLDLVRSMGIEPQTVKRIRYRGKGWPGHFKVSYGNNTQEKRMTYMQSWGRVAGNRPFRCHLCPDGLGELADVTSGDAWNKYKESDENPGLSHVLVRTPKGRDLIRKAIAAGYLDVIPSSPDEVIDAQGLVQRRREVFGRQLGMWLLGVPSTTFLNFALAKCWLQDSLLTMVRTVLGTQKRLLVRGLWHRNPKFTKR